MPLDRTHITRASRIMLPIYPMLAVIVGLGYSLTPHARIVRSPILSVAARMLPMPAWGGIFLLIGAVEVAAMLTRKRFVYVVALSVQCGAMVVWAVVFAVAAFHGQGSYSAFAWPAFTACACWATIRSLATREVQ